MNSIAAWIYAWVFALPAGLFLAFVTLLAIWWKR